MPYGAACPWEAASLLLLQEQQGGFGRGWHLDEKRGTFSFAGVGGVRVSVHFKRGGEASAFLLWCQEKAPKGYFGELMVGWGGGVSPPWLPCKKRWAQRSITEQQAE